MMHDLNNYIHTYMSTQSDHTSVLHSLKMWVQYPVLALVSKQFYYKVLFELRGLGGSYLLALSIALAVPASFKVLGILATFSALNLPALVTQIPPSYINKHGVLSPNDPSLGFRVITNHNHAAVIVYNPENRTLDSELTGAPFELQSDGLVIRGSGQQSKVSYQSFVGTDISFEPMTTASMLETILASGFFSIWPMVTLWFFLILSFNTMLSGLISRILAILFIKLRMDFRAMLRLAAFANTSIALLLLLQFYVYFPIPFAVMCMIPIMYLIWFCRIIRQHMNRIGSEALRSSRRLRRTDLYTGQGASGNAAGTDAQEGLDRQSPDAQEREDEPSSPSEHEEERAAAARRVPDEAAAHEEESRPELNDNGRGGRFTP